MSVNLEETFGWKRNFSIKQKMITLSKCSPGIVACSSVQAPNTFKGQDTFILFSQSCNNVAYAGSLAPGSEPLGP